MTITKLGYKRYLISDIIGTQFVKHQFIDYTKREAIKLFREYVKITF